MSASVRSGSVIVRPEMISWRDWKRGQPPVYRVQEVAKVFFGMSASWLRLKLQATDDRPGTSFMISGVPMEFRRTEQGARVFWLSDIQPMAESLYNLGDIKVEKLRAILRVVEAQAQLFELTP